MHIVAVNRSPEAGRAIVRQRNAIDHKLGLILRATRVHDGVAFIEPPRLRIHQVLQGTARNRAQPVLDEVGGYLANRASLIGVDQCVRRSDGYGFIYRRQFELDGVFDRDRGMNFDNLGRGYKARLPYFELIDAVRQALHVQVALFAGGKSISIAVRLADDLNRRFHAKTGRIGHSEAQFAAITLAKERHGAEDENGGKSLHEELAFLV